MHECLALQTNIGHIRTTAPWNRCIRTPKRALFAKREIPFREKGISHEKGLYFLILLFIKVQIKLNNCHGQFIIYNNRNKCSRKDEYRYEKANPSLFVKRLSSFRVNVLSRKEVLYVIVMHFI